MNTNKSILQSFRTSKRLVKALAFVVIAMTLSACNNAADSLGQSAPLTVSDIDKQGLLRLAEPTLVSQNRGREFIEINLGMNGDTNLIELDIDELSLQQVLDSVGFLPTNAAISDQIRTLYKDIPAVSTRKITVNQAGAFTVENLKPQTYYRIVARACIDGTADRQCSQSVDILDKTLSLPLGQVTLIKADASSVTVELGWAAASGADFYRIERQDSGAEWRSMFGDLFVLSRTDATIFPNLTYKYRVRACQYSDASRSNTGCVISNEIEVRIPENYRATRFPSANVQAEAGMREVNITITSLNKPELPVYYLQERKDNNQYVTLKKIDERNVQERIHNVRHEGREPETEYQYRVHACSATETDNCNSWYIFRATTLQPAEPVRISGEVLGATSNQITWTKGSIATSYVVSRRLAADNQNVYQEIGVVSATDPAIYTDTNLESDRAYEYVVASCTGSGREKECSTPSNAVRLQTDPNLQNRVSIRNLTVTASVLNRDQLTIRWDAYDPAPSFYQIDVSQDGISGWGELSASQTQIRYVHQGLLGGTPYQYRVRACIRNTENCTPYEEETGETSSRFTLAPTITAALVLGSGTDAAVTWDSLTDVTQQTLKARTRTTGSRVVDPNVIDFGVVELNQSTKEVSNLNQAKDYQFFLELCKTGGACDETTTSSQWLATVAPISTTVDFIPANGVDTYASHRQIQLSWNYGGTQPEFYFYRRTDVVAQQTTNIVKIPRATGTATLLLQDSLTPDTEYLYEVRPCITDHSCTSNWAQMSVTTDIRLASAPTLISVKSLSFDRVEINFAVPMEATYYMIMRKEKNAENFTPLTGQESITTADPQVYFDTNVTQGATYSYKIQACREYATNCRNSITRMANIPFTLDEKPVFSTPSTTFSTVDLRWSYQDSNSQTSVYFVLENKISGANAYEEIDDAITGVTRTIENLSPATNYVARIQACLVILEGGTENCSLWSEEVTYTTKILPIADQLTASLQSGNAISLSWTNIAPAPQGAVYKITRQIGGTGAYVDVTNIVDLNTKTYLDENLVYDTTYRYQVQICLQEVCSEVATSSAIKTDINLSTLRPSVSITPGIESGVITLTGAPTGTLYKVSVTNKDGANVVRDEVVTRAAAMHTVSSLNRNDAPYTVTAVICKDVDTTDCGSIYTEQFTPSNYNVEDYTPGVTVQPRIGGATLTQLSGAPENTRYKIEWGVTNAVAEGKKNRYVAIGALPQLINNLTPGTEYTISVQICDPVPSGSDNCSLAENRKVTPWWDLDTLRLGLTSTGQVEQALIEMSGKQVVHEYKIKVSGGNDYSSDERRLKTSPLNLDKLSADNNPYTVQAQICRTEANGGACAPEQTSSFSVKRDLSKLALTVNVQPKVNAGEITFTGAEAQTFYSINIVDKSNKNIVTDHEVIGNSYSQDDLSVDSAPYKVSAKICDTGDKNRCGSVQITQFTPLVSQTDVVPTVRVDPQVNGASVSLGGAPTGTNYKVVVTDKDGGEVSDETTDTSPLVILGLNPEKNPHKVVVQVCGSSITTGLNNCTPAVEGVLDALWDVNTLTPTLTATKAVEKVTLAISGAKEGTQYKVRLKSLKTNNVINDDELEYDLRSVEYDSLSADSNGYQAELKICLIDSDICSSSVNDQFEVDRDLTNITPDVVANAIVDGVEITLTKGFSDTIYQLTIGYGSTTLRENDPVSAFEEITGLSSTNGKHYTTAKICLRSNSLICGPSSVNKEFRPLPNTRNLIIPEVDVTNMVEGARLNLYRGSIGKEYKVRIFDRDNHELPGKGVTTAESQVVILDLDPELSPYVVKAQICEASETNCGPAGSAVVTPQWNLVTVVPTIEALAKGQVEAVLLQLSGRKVGLEYDVEVQDVNNQQKHSGKTSEKSIVVPDLLVAGNSYTARLRLCRTGLDVCGEYKEVNFDTLRAFFNLPTPTVTTTAVTEGARVDLTGLTEGTEYKVRVFDNANNELPNKRVTTEQGVVDLALDPALSPYVVKAQICAKETEGSGCSLAVADSVAPAWNLATPTIINASTVEAGAVQLQLAGRTNALEYDIVVDNSNDQEKARLRTKNESITLANLPVSGNGYTVRVRLCRTNTNQCGVYNTASFNTIPLTRQPIVVVSPVGEVEAIRLQLSGNTPGLDLSYGLTGGLEYEIVVDNSSDQEQFRMKTADSEVVVANLPISGNSYTARVRLCRTDSDVCGEYRENNFDTLSHVRMEITPSPAGVMIYLKGGIPGTTVYKMSITHGSDTVEKDKIVENTYYVNDLTVDTMKYIVKAKICGVSNSQLCGPEVTQEFTPLAPLSPSVSPPIVPVLQGRGGDATVYLSWTDDTLDSSFAVRYTVHQSTETFAGKSISTYRTSAANYKQKNTVTKIILAADLTNDTPYFFVVTAYKDGATSAVSNEVTATPSVFKKPLNDTGITWRQDPATSTTCSNFYEAQDCNHGRDATHNDDNDGDAGFSFTKLDSNGNALSADASTWSCVRDNVTNLVWEVKTTTPGIHNKDNKYRWGGITAIGMGHRNRLGDYHNDWNALVFDSKSTKLCGFYDWRVPTNSELLSIVNFGKHSPVIDDDYFPNTTQDMFWTASPYVFGYLNEQALAVAFGFGRVDPYSRSKKFRVRLVRGKQLTASKTPTPIVPAKAQNIKNYINNEWSDSRYTTHDNGTVTDKVTGLIWKKCLQGRSGSTCATGTDSKFYWQETFENASRENFASNSDWRVPNVKELQSLLALDRFYPAMNETIFPNASYSFIWTASPYINGTGGWAINVGLGGSVHPFFPNHAFPLRLVRDSE